MEILKLIFCLVSTANFAYLALLMTQYLLCEDVRKFRYKNLSSVPWMDRLKRFWRALQVPKYVTLILLCIAFWSIEFKFLNEFKAMIILGKSWYYVIFAITGSIGFIRLFHYLGYRLELFEQLFGSNEHR